MSKNLVAAIAAAAGVGVGFIFGIIGTASLSDKELEKLRKDIGVVPNVPKENTSNTSSKEEEKVEG